MYSDRVHEVNTSRRKRLIYRLKGYNKYRQEHTHTLTFNIYVQAAREYLFGIFHRKDNMYRIGSKKDKQANRLQSDCINRRDSENVQYIC